MTDLDHTEGASGAVPDSLPEPSTRPTDPPGTGRVLAERYSLGDELGSGGMGTVYRARDRRLDRQVVVKLLSTHLVHDSAAVKRFEREARAASALNHPHIVTVTDAGLEDGTPYIVMEYLSGADLTSVLREHGKLGWPWVRTCALQVLDALGAAHEHGIVHRDVKPSNCRCVGYRNLDTAVHVKLLDFGVAKFADQQHDDTITAAGVVLGTLTYVSPEQARGGHVDPRSDIYSVGILLFELLTGRPPFLGRSALDIMLQHVSEPVPRMRDVASGVSVPEGVEAVVRRCLAKRPEDRFQSVRDVARALEAVAPASTPHASTGPSPAELPSGTTEVSELFTREILPVDDFEWFELRGLLDKVRRFWLDSVLARSEFGGVLVDQTRTVEFDSVTTDWERQYRSIVPEGAQPVLVETFENLSRKLLILGDAGCGKTLNLLAIARYLAERSGRHARFTEAVPVVFNLSTWSASHGSFATWLAREFGSKYQVPQRVAQGWVRNHRIIPLLDGLDEVSTPERQRCVQAINEYATQFLPPGLVVTCRTLAYEQAGVQLAVNGALRLHPLDGAQVEQFLESGGDRWLSVRDAIERDHTLAELARTPLLLNVMTRSLGDSARAREFTLDSQPPSAGRLYEAYMEELYRRGERSRPITGARALRHHLRWLAQGMLEHRQTIFRVEELQPTWLGSGALFWTYHLATRTIGALLLGLGAVLAFGLSPLDNGGYQTSVAFSLRLALFGAVVFGVAYGVGSALARPVQGERGKLRPAFTHVAVAVVLGLLVGGLAGSGSSAPAVYVMGVELALCTSVILGMGRTGRSAATDISVADSLRWRWTRFAQGLPLVLGITTLLFLTATWMRDSMAGAYIATLIAVIGSAVAGLEAAPAKPSEEPNGGMRRTLRKGLLAFAVMFALSASFFATSYGTAYGASVGLALGTFMALRFGGFEVICHYVLRLLISVSRRVSANLPSILNECSDLAILRKVGGGYMFMHRSLLDHVARSATLLVCLLGTLVTASGCEPRHSATERARWTLTAPRAARRTAHPATASPAPGLGIADDRACAGKYRGMKPIDREPGLAADVAAADLNGDGAMDLVSASGNDRNPPGPLSLLFGPFSGSTPAKVENLTSHHYRRLAVGDVNGDGLPDIAAALTWPNSLPQGDERPTVAVFTSKKPAPFTWEESTRLKLGSPAAAVALGDVDADGDLDLAVVMSDLRTSTDDKARLVRILVNQNGKFKLAEWEPTMKHVGLGGRFADVTGDDRLDLIVTQFAKHTPGAHDWCWYFAGTAASDGGVRLSRTPTPCGARLMDGSAMAHAAALDVAVNPRPDGTRAILGAFNTEQCGPNSQCVLTPRTLLTRPDATILWQPAECCMSAAVRSADVDSDGKEDVVVATWSDADPDQGDRGPVTLYCGNAAGSFGGVRVLEGKTFTMGLALADVDSRGLVTKTQEFALSGPRSLVTLSPGFVQSISKVTLNDTPLHPKQYGFSVGGSWVSFKEDELSGGGTLKVDYVVSTSIDFVVNDARDPRHLFVHYSQ